MNIPHVLVLLVETYDTWMVQRLENLNFRVQVLVVDWICNLGPIEGFASDDLAARPVGRSPDDGKGSFAQVLALYIIVLEVVLSLDLGLPHLLRKEQSQFSQVGN